ncbi:MAG TPA: Ppx/GppA phosphatase family protein, partial [Thermoplasmata archaeon]
MQGAAPARSPESLPLISVIDIGSNTIRLVEYEIVGRVGLRLVRAFKEVPRLGHAALESGALSRDAIEQGARSVRRLLALLPSERDRTTVAVATSAVRDAPNRAAFVDRVRSVAGIVPKVISGAEEGRYAYLGVSDAWRLGSDLVVDLGGGSMLVVHTRNGRAGRATSMPLGTVRMTDRYFHHDPPRDREVEALRENVREHLDALPDRSKGGRIFVVGGTARALARTSMELGDSPLRTVHGQPLRARELKGLAAIVRPMAAKRRRELPGIDRTRAEVIVAGLVTLRELAERFDATELTVSTRGIRDGLALETAGIPVAANSEELVDRSALVEARTVRFSLAHGRDVAEKAAHLFDAVRRRLGWGEEERLALRAAALLHDIGTVVDPWHHALHSAYLLRHTAIGGLSRRASGLAVIAVSGHEGEP